MTRAAADARRERRRLIVRRMLRLCALGRCRHNTCLSSMLRFVATVVTALAMAVTPAATLPWAARREAVAWAAMPAMLNYQGRVAESSGKPVQGALTMTFRLYGAESGGSAMWSEDHTLALAEADNGIFNVILGETTPLTTMDFNSSLWLSIQIAGDSEMTPRQRLTATGYAMNADKLDALDSTSFMRTDVDTSTSGKLTITRAGTALLIKPVTDPVSTTKMVDLQNAAGTSKFSVDAAGNVSVAGDLSVSGSIAGSTTITGTTNASWNIGSAMDATTKDVSVLFGQTTGQKSIVYKGTGTQDFAFSDPIRLKTQSALRLEDAGSSYVGLKAPTSATTYTMTLPSAVGSAGQVLSTDASGNLSWVSSSGVTGAITQITAGTGLTGGGSSGNVTIALSTPVSVTNGGTGAGSFTSNGVVYGGATLTSTSAGTTGTVLHGNTGAAPSFSAVNLSADVTSTLPLNRGGTNNASLANCTSGQALTVTGGAVACTSTIIASGAAANSLDFTEFKNTMTLDADTTINLSSYNLIVGQTKSTNVFQLQNAQGTPNTAKFYVDDTGTAGAAHLNITASGGNINLNNDVTIKTAAYNQATAAGGLHIAVDPTVANSDGVLYLGRKSDEIGGWGSLRYNSTNKKLTWNGATFELEGDSPAGISFGTGANAQRLVFDGTSSSIGTFSFTGGSFSQQFRNLVRNGSFEAFSQAEAFNASSASCPSGGCGGAGSTFQGGWQNFTPDEWTWDGGNVYQNAPVLFTPSTTVTSTTLQNEYYHGKSAVTLEDTNVATNGPYNGTTDGAANYGAPITDAHIEQTISGLKPSTVYSVGAYMRRVNATAEAIVDIIGEDSATTTTLTAAMGTTDGKMTVTSLSAFPTSGIVVVDSERISYTGKDTANSQLTQLVRGYDGTTAASHSSSATVTMAAFQHLTTAGSATPDVFTLYRGQFVTLNDARDVKLHLICTGTTLNDKCRFDAVQIVEGHSVPEFSPSSIVDTGDQTLYGSLHMGRTADSRGGILSVDRAVRTRGIEFFDKDPGLSGTTGGFGGIGAATKIASGAGSTTTMTTSGTFYGSNPRDMLVTVTALAPAKFKWEYRDCSPSTGCTGVYVSGGSNLLVSDYASGGAQFNVPLASSMGVIVTFANTGTITTTDQWSFGAAGTDMAQQYSSYSGTSTYQPGNTRIYKDLFSKKLTFQDGTTIVSLDKIPGANLAQPAHVEWPSFYPATTGGGQMYLNTSQGYAGTAVVTFDVQICADGTSPNRDSYQWRDNIINGGNVAAADWDITCTQIPASGGPTSTLQITGSGAVNYGFTLTFGSPAGTWRDANNGDRWQVKAYPAANGCADAQVLKWNNAQQQWVCAVDDTGASVNAPNNATYILQTSNANLANAQALSALASGYMKVTAGTGVVSSVASVPDADVVDDLTIASTKAGSFSPTSDVTPLTLKRGTDSSPAANLLSIRNNANTTDLFVINPSGKITIGSADVGLLTTGQLALARGGTHADLSGTGGAGFVLKQNSLGADVTVAALTDADVLDDLTIASTKAGSFSTTSAARALDISSTTASGTGYAGYFAKTGAATTNVGLYATATGGVTNNYAAIFDQGNVGVGLTNPGAALEVRSTSNAAFRVGNGPLNYHLTVDETTGNTSMYTFSSQNVRTTTGGDFDLLNAGNFRLIGTGEIQGYQQPVKISRNWANMGTGTSLIVDNDTDNTPPSGYKIASFRLSGAEKAYVYNDGGAYFAGNVGIGTTTPQAALDVRGDLLTPTGSYLSPYGGVGRYQNLCLQSEDQSTTWADATGTAVTVQANLAAANPAPNGTTTADRLTQGSSTAGAGRKQDLTSLGALANRTFTFSLWVKAATAHTARLQLKTVTNTQPAQNISVTTTWQRFGDTYTIPGGDANTTLTAIVDLDDGATYTANGIDVWGAQVEENATPGVYIRTTTATVAASQGAVTDGVPTGSGSGTVTSVATGLGLTGGPITTTGTVALDESAALSGDHALNANEVKFGQSGLIFEGTSADTIETYFTLDNPTVGDQTFKLPNLGAVGTQYLASDAGAITNLHGTGLAITGTQLDFAPGELNSLTWGDGTQASFTHTFNVTGVNDPVITFGNNFINVSTGTLQQGGTAVVLQTRTLTGGAGIATIGDLSADRTIAVDSTKQGFLTAGALTCGASTNGKMQVHTTPLQYCDNAGTPLLKYAAYGDSSGNATNAAEVGGMSANGLVARTGAGTYTNRTLTSASANQIVITNGDGVAGNPTIGLSYAATLATNSLGVRMTVHDNTDAQGGLLFEGATNDTFQTLLTVAEPTGSDKTITLPNVTGTVVVDKQNSLTFGDATQATFTHTFDVSTGTDPVLTFGNGTITSNSQLILSGVATDVTTGTNEDLVISPNGTGNVGINMTAPVAKLEAQGMTAASGTGNLSTSGTTTVTGGGGTAFTTQLHVGDTITASSQTRRVTAIASATSLTVDSVFSPDLSAAAFTYQQPTMRLDNSSGAAQMTINSQGNVGIGTAAPAALLHVSGGAAAVDANQKVSLNGNAASNDSYLKFDSTNSRISFFINGKEIARLKD